MFDSNYPDQLTITVTAEDWREGIACDFGHCAVALAAQPLAREDHVVGVSKQAVAFWNPDRTKVQASYENPEALVRLIQSFDNGHEYGSLPQTFVLPATFELERVR